MPDPDEFERQATARALSCAARSRILAAEGVTLSRRVRTRSEHSEFLGLVSFERWLIDSGRVADDGGSPWWRTVNGLLLLDIEESARVDGTADPAGPVHSWRMYREAATGRKRQGTWWTAHEHSLDIARAAAHSMLATESAAEQAFIATSIASVQIAGSATLSTRWLGSWAIRQFCSTFYPHDYPAGEDAGNQGSELLERHSQGRLPGLRITRSVLNHRWRADPTSKI